MIVPGGGIALDGKRWLSCQPRFLLPVPVLTKLFQGLMLAKLLAAHKAGRLTMAIEAHWANDQYDRLPAMAAELVRARVALIVAHGNNLPARAAKNARQRIV
jgi:hypothetical protein